jgi:peptide/nickel transport system substrate-binding protein
MKQLICFKKIFCVLSLLAFVSQAAVAAEPANELRIALNTEFETLHPNINSMMAGIYVLDATVHHMVVQTVEGKTKTMLLKELPSLKNETAEFLPGEKQKGLKIQIEMLPKATWGDGKPVTCEDLKMSWTVGVHPNTSTPDRVNFENITDIQVDEKNPKKCSVTFKEAKWNYYLNLPRPIPAHIEGPVFNQYKETPQAYERNSAYIRDVTNPGLYNGAYRVSELKLGSHVILVPNEHFYGEAPKIKKMIFKFLTNTGTIDANLQSGGINMSSSTGMSHDQAVAFEKKVKEDKLPFEVVFVPGVIYTHLDFNLDLPIFQDVKVRKAFAFAINKEEITQAFFDGKLKPALHFSSEVDSWYTDKATDVTLYKYSKAKAQDLLEEAGWKVGGGGYRYKNGQKLSVTINSAADNKVTEKIEVYMQGQLKQVGIELLIKNFPARVLFSEILRKRKFEMGMYSWVSAPDGMQFGTLNSSMIPTEANSFSGQNRPGWKNKDVDKWTEEVEREFDPKKRVTLMKKIMKAYTDELPAMPLYYKANNAVIPKGLKNFKLSGHSYTEFLNAETWTF